jgi:5-enolpyruvylshikimate-3-phosphate synthase
MRVRNLVILLFLLFSCKAKQELVQSEKVDSVRITEHYVEQVVHVPGDSVKASFPLIVENNRPVPASVKVKGDRSSLKIQVTEQGNIEASAICDEYEAKVQVLERTVERYEKEAAVYREKETTFQKTIRDLHAALKYGTIIIVVIVALKYAKPVWTFIKTILK